ncbi:hypothetical protein NDA01_21515 [Trichocoleus desertorum AS-A10]|uniref:hypothetical protein n=1 Tax=Trichocoleus desertorum TaxID=1481672 RepID=UPI003296B2F5
MCDELPENKKFVIDLLEQALERYEAEYSELFDRWRGLESKAQVALTTSGIFVSASGLLVKEVGSTFPSEMNLALAFAIALLVLSVTCSVTVLVVRPLESSPTGEGYTKYALDALRVIERLDNGIADYQIHLIQDKIRVWQDTVVSLRDGNDLKAQCLKTAQYLLLAGLLLVASAIIITIFWKQNKGVVS